MKETSPEKKPRLRRVRKRLLAGALGLVALFSANKFLLDEAGEHSRFWPTQQPQVETDSTYKVGTWNIHKENRVEQIGKLFREKSFSALMLQEITKRDAIRINKRFPYLYTTFVSADALNQPLAGGVGNAIVTELKPGEDIRTVGLEGSSNGETLRGMINGIRVDIDNLNFSMTKTKDGRQEPRSAIALTAPLGPEQDDEKVDLITGHIAYDRQVHDSQKEAFFEFVRDQTSDDRPAIVCADFNPHSEGEIPLAFADMSGFIAVDTEPTNPTRSYPIDMCAYSENGVLGYHAESGIMPEYSTDHTLAFVEWDLEGK